jgi:hypothetical protein
VTGTPAGAGTLRALPSMYGGRTKACGNLLLRTQYDLLLLLLLLLLL